MTTIEHEHKWVPSLASHISEPYPGWLVVLFICIKDFEEGKNCDATLIDVTEAAEV